MAQNLSVSSTNFPFKYLPNIEKIKEKRILEQNKLQAIAKEFTVKNIQL
ncbi:MAG: hypothetical protein K6E76_05420 [Patescibacteria group bacterium]|jgi:hypothetical protein|nr:hypothetical protein [Patescibacteria group bacterium]